MNYSCLASTEYASQFFLGFNVDFFFFLVKRVVFLLSGPPMKLCYLEHTQHKVTCKYMTPFNKAFSMRLPTVIMQKGKIHRFCEAGYVL